MANDWKGILLILMSYRHISSCPSSGEGEGVSEGGAVVRALVTHQSSLGSKPGVDARCGLSLLLHWFSPLLREVFAGVPGTPFQRPPPPTPLSSKTNIYKFQFRWGIINRRRTVCMCYLYIVIYLFIYLFIYALINLSRFLWNVKANVYVNIFLPHPLRVFVII